MWCAPENVRILTVNNQIPEYIKKVTNTLEKITLDNPLSNNKLRYMVDDSADSLGKKIRRATNMKIPCVIIVGPKDAENSEVSVRLRDREEKVVLDELAEFIKGI